MKKYIRLIVLLLSVATLFAGAIQAIAPAFVLNFIGAEINTTTKLLFAIIGMFMFLFGGMMVHGLYHEDNNRVVLIWSVLQKSGASAAIFIGIFNGTFIPLAAGVALFDLFSAIMFFYYLRKYVIA